MSIDPQLSKSFRSTPRTIEQMKPRKVVIQEGAAEQEKSPTFAARSPRGAAPGPALSKQRSQRASCLCSPTTHAGSFRCRLHRSSLRPSGASVGSRLSELADKANRHGAQQAHLDDLTLSRS